MSSENGAVVRLSINVSPEIAADFKAVAARKGLTITEGICRAITVWKFAEDESAAGNELAVIGKDGEIRKVVLL